MGQALHQALDKVEKETVFALRSHSPVEEKDNHIV